MGHNMQSTVMIMIPVLSTKTLQVYAHRNNIEINFNDFYYSQIGGGAGYGHK